MDILLQPVHCVHVSHSDICYFENRIHAVMLVIGFLLIYLHLQFPFAVFEPYKDSKVDTLAPKLLFIALNLAGMGLGVWKVSCANSSLFILSVLQIEAGINLSSHWFLVDSLTPWVFFQLTRQIGFHHCLLLRYDLIAIFSWDQWTINFVLFFLYYSWRRALKKQTHTIKKKYSDHPWGF